MLLLFIAHHPHLNDSISKELALQAAKAHLDTEYKYHQRALENKERGFLHWVPSAVVLATIFPHLAGVYYQAE